jgi:hypothetical protein
MISLRYYKKYKNRLRFDIVIKDWKKIIMVGCYDIVLRQ